MADASPAPTASGDPSRHVLLFIHSLAQGGAERVAASLLNDWAARGWRVTLLTIEHAPVDAYPVDPRIGRETLAMAESSGSPLHALWSNAQRVRALRGVLQRLQPDVALGFMTSASILLALARSGWNGVALGAERVHPPAVPLRAPWGALRRWTYRFLDAVVVQTELSAAWIRAHTRARVVRVIPNPVNWPLGSTGPGRAPVSVGVPGRRRVLGAGRLETQKGFDRLIEAFAAIDLPDWELVILGEGPQRATLEAQVARLGLANRVFLPGGVTNMADWYQGSDLFVLSSAFEGFPNVLVEAMAHGLPAVSFNCDTGPADIIRDGVDGLLVASGDVAALRTAMERLMRDASQRRRLGERAMDVRERFAAPLVMQQWDQLITDLARERSRPVRQQ